MSDHTTCNSSVKLCECGCGQPAPIATRSNRKWGHIKGQPMRYCVGHAARVREIRPAEERFWEKVEKRGSDECWPWTAASDQHGYGTFWDGERLTKAHRFSYSLANGSCPDDLDCLHKCDNPCCVNPSHLFLGTAKDNIRDMKAKGRGVYHEGERLYNAMLTNAQARELRNQFAVSNRSVAAFAAFHEIPYMVMWNIIRGKTYKHA